MDFELIFWLCAVAVLPVVAFGALVCRDYMNDRARQWRREHADNFNMDVWED